MHTKLIKAPMRRSRRRYTEEFKKQAIEACLLPGVSMASVALANGLNANLLRRWVTERQEEVTGSVTLLDQMQLEGLILKHTARRWDSTRAAAAVPAKKPADAAATG